MTDRHSRLTLCALALIGVVSCQASPRDQLRAVLIKEYGPAALPTVGFTAGSTHLFLLFEGLPFRPFPDSLVAVRQREVARFALAHYEDSAKLDGITVVFNEHEGIVGATREHAASGRFAVTDLR